MFTLYARYTDEDSYVGKFITAESRDAARTEREDDYKKDSEFVKFVNGEDL
jgi:hypothetical protein